jgi:hypothetical protein
MRRFLTQGGLVPLVLVMMAGLGTFVLRPPAAPAALAAADEIASHRSQCLVCTLPAYGRNGVTSILGHDSTVLSMPEKPRHME